MFKKDPVSVSDIFWVSTHSFVVIYSPQAPGDKIPNFVFLASSVSRHCWMGLVVLGDLHKAYGQDEGMVKAKAFHCCEFVGVWSWFCVLKIYFHLLKVFWKNCFLSFSSSFLLLLVEGWSPQLCEWWGCVLWQRRQGQQVSLLLHWDLVMIITCYNYNVGIHHMNY